MKSSDVIISTAVRQALSGAVSLRFAEVTAINGTKLTVDFDGVSVADVPFLKSYSPTVGDRAWLLYQGYTLVALGAN